MNSDRTALWWPPDAEAEPVFVVGVPRSGTTVLRLMLNRHPALAMLPETWFGSRVWDKRWSIALALDPREIFTSVLDDFIRLLTEKQPDGFDIDVIEYRHHVLAGRLSITRILSCLGEVWSKRQQKPRWGEKSPIHAYYLLPLARMFPRMKVLHIVRDPRDVAVSLANVEFDPSDDVVVHALQWKRETVAVQAASAAITLMDVRYEDVVSDPQKTLRRICSFLGIVYDDQMLNFHESYEEDAPKREWTRGARLPLNASSIGRFHREIGEHELALVEAIVLEGLGRYGYSIETDQRELQRLRPIVQRIIFAQEEAMSAERSRHGDVVPLPRDLFERLLRERPQNE
jgi:hypothetical protein